MVTAISIWGWIPPGTSRAANVKCIYKASSPIGQRFQWGIIPSHVHEAAMPMCSRTYPQAYQGIRDWSYLCTPTKCLWLQQ